jgi:glycosyltransferase involved in cell wall biosynthesis
MKNKKIDVLMAVFNGEKYIRQQVESILNQTYKNIHLSIRDNCSEDRTREIVSELIIQYPNQITLLPSFQNVGIIGNFSALIDQAKADYIMLSDSDDVWLPEKIAKTMKKMEELEARYEAGTPLLVHTDLHVVNENLGIIHPSFWKYCYLNPKLPHTLSRQLIQNQITGCTLMINRALSDIAQPIPQEAIMHDWWLGICTAAFGKSDIVDEPTLLYRQHGKNETGAKRYSFAAYLKVGSNRMMREKAIQAETMAFRQAQTFLN